MQRKTSAKSKKLPGKIAYLVVREGSTWRDVFRLTPGQVTTIGRAPTNRIVIRDEICSRNHCEVFQSGLKWTLRDLGSRNGTLINGTRVVGDWELSEGQLVQIGECQLGFTFDLSQPFSQFEEAGEVESDTETAMELVFDHPATESEPAIIHRTRNTRYQSSSPPEAVDRDRTSQELAKLYRLALEMGSAADAKSLSEVVLEGLFSGTCSDIGAILLLPKGITSDPKPRQLRVIAYRAEGDVPYQKVSDYLSSVVLDNREAVLARDISDDSRLAGRDSLGEIHAKSVICAPLRVGLAIYGLIHLYSTNPDNPLDPDDLEFTLAVADQLAVALENLKQKESLAVGLARAQDENLTLRRQLELESELVGDSRSIEQLRESIARIGPTDATVLIRGGERGRQRACRTGHSLQQSAAEQSDCLHELCGLERNSAGKRTVRS